MDMLQALLNKIDGASTTPTFDYSHHSQDVLETLRKDVPPEIKSATDDALQRKDKAPLSALQDNDRWNKLRSHACIELECRKRESAWLSLAIDNLSDVQRTQSDPPKVVSQEAHGRVPPGVRPEAALRRPAAEPSRLGMNKNCGARCSRCPFGSCIVPLASLRQLPGDTVPKKALVCRKCWDAAAGLEPWPEQALVVAQHGAGSVRGVVPHRAGQLPSVPKQQQAATSAAPDEDGLDLAPLARQPRPGFLARAVLSAAVPAPPRPTAGTGVHTSKRTGTLPLFSSRPAPPLPRPSTLQPAQMMGDGHPAPPAAVVRPSRIKQERPRPPGDDKAHAISIEDDDCTISPACVAAAGPAAGTRHSARLASQQQDVSDAKRFQGLRFCFPERASKDSVEVTADDFSRLEDWEFLNDSVIDFYIKLIESKLGKVERDACHFFNTFFYKKLTEHNPAAGPQGDLMWKQNHERVSKWTKGVDIFDKRFLFVPVHEDLHWTLAVVCHPGCVAGGDRTHPCFILHMDSMADGHKTGPVGRALQHYLRWEWERLASSDPHSRPSLQRKFAGQPGGQQSPVFSDIKCERVQPLPRQMNHCDCGLFLLAYLEFFVHHLPQKLLPLRDNRGQPALKRRFLQKDWFKSENASQLRGYIKALMCRYMAQQLAATQARPGLPPAPAAALPGQAEGFAAACAVAAPAVGDADEAKQEEAPTGECEVAPSSASEQLADLQAQGAVGRPMDAREEQLRRMWAEYDAKPYRLGRRYLPPAEYQAWLDTLPPADVACGDEGRRASQRLCSKRQELADQALARQLQHKEDAEAAARDMGQAAPSAAAVSGSPCDPEWLPDGGAENRGASTRCDFLAEEAAAVKRKRPKKPMNDSDAIVVSPEASSLCGMAVQVTTAAATANAPAMTKKFRRRQASARDGALEQHCPIELLDAPSNSGQQDVPSAPASNSNSGVISAPTQAASEAQLPPQPFLSRRSRPEAHNPVFSSGRGTGGSGLEEVPNHGVPVSVAAAKPPNTHIHFTSDSDSDAVAAADCGDQGSAGAAGGHAQADARLLGGQGGQADRGDAGSQPGSCVESQLGGRPHAILPAAGCAPGGAASVLFEAVVALDPDSIMEVDHQDYSLHCNAPSLTPASTAQRFAQFHLGASDPYARSGSIECNASAPSAPAPPQLYAPLPPEALHQDVGQGQADASQSPAAPCERELVHDEAGASTSQPVPQIQRPRRVGDRLTASDEPHLDLLDGPDRAGNSPGRVRQAGPGAEGLAVLPSGGTAPRAGPPQGPTYAGPARAEAAMDLTLDERDEDRLTCSTAGRKHKRHKSTAAEQPVASPGNVGLLAGAHRQETSMDHYHALVQDTLAGAPDRDASDTF